MEAEPKPTMRRVTFNNRSTEIVGNLHLPAEFDDSQSRSAIVLTTPGSSVKEQVGGTYAGKLAEHGFVALTFDPSHQGESGGVPRDLEDPAVRVEDIRCAIDFLATQPFVSMERIGLLGICAGGGYAIQAALTERRFKAVGTVVASDLGNAFRRMAADQGGLLPKLEEVGRQRTAEAHGAPARRDPWIPDSLLEAKAAGIEDPEVLELCVLPRVGASAPPLDEPPAILELRQDPEFRRLPPCSRTAHTAAPSRRGRPPRGDRSIRIRRASARPLSRP